jgi:hypothetical protein
MPLLEGHAAKSKSSSGIAGLAALPQLKEVETYCPTHLTCLTLLVLMRFCGCLHIIAICINRNL